MKPVAQPAEPVTNGRKPFITEHKGQPAQMATAEFLVQVTRGNLELFKLAGARWLSDELTRVKIEQAQRVRTQPQGFYMGYATALQAVANFLKGMELAVGDIPERYSENGPAGKGRVG